MLVNSIQIVFLRETAHHFSTNEPCKNHVFHDISKFPPISLSLSFKTARFVFYSAIFVSFDIIVYLVSTKSHK